MSAMSEPINSDQECPIDIDIDIDELLLRKIIECGGTKEDFDNAISTIDKYEARTGKPDLAFIFIDSLSCGMTIDQFTTQCKIYNIKASDAISY